MSALVDRRKRRTVAICAAVFFGMLGLSFAAVPLYDLFCRVTGYGGTPQVATQAPGVSSAAKMVVRFNADVDRKLPWSFQPVERQVSVGLGEERIIAYRATNQSDRAITGNAVFNVSPEKAGPYFDKIACFCFTQQRIEPGQTVDLPVSFFVDPKIAEDRTTRDIKVITLSYTFYETPPDKLAATVR